VEKYRKKYKKNKTKKTKQNTGDEKLEKVSCFISRDSKV